MEASGKVVISSFRLVFARGYRRLFKIDRYRLPFAYGLPILGILYAALVAVALVLAARLTIAGPGLAAPAAPGHRRPGAGGAPAADPLGRAPGRAVDGDAALAPRRPDPTRGAVGVARGGVHGPGSVVLAARRARRRRDAT